MRSEGRMLPLRIAANAQCERGREGAWLGRFVRRFAAVPLLAMRIKAGTDYGLTAPLVIIYEYSIRVNPTRRHSRYVGR